MIREIAHVALVVNDYDEAIEYFTRTIGFILVEDKDLGDGKRWVLVKPKDSLGACLLLSKASNESQARSIGNQTGGRVFLFLQTDNFDKDYQLMKERGVEFCETPRNEQYGKVVVFSDLYGNKWDLIEYQNEKT